MIGLTSRITWTRITRETAVIEMQYAVSKQISDERIENRYRNAVTMARRDQRGWKSEEGEDGQRANKQKLLIRRTERKFRVAYKFGNVGRIVCTNRPRFCVCTHLCTPTGAGAARRGAAAREPP